MSETYYKVLGEDGEARYGKGKWSLPRGDKPGQWKRAWGKLDPCKNGLHLCRRSDLLTWIGPRIFEVEVGGSRMIQCEDKVVVRRARLVREFVAWGSGAAQAFWKDCGDRAWDALAVPEYRAWQTDRLFDYLEGRAS